MRLLTIALLLAVLAVTLTHAVALPGGGGGKGVPRCKNETVIVPNEAARWHCTHKYKVMFSHYTLRGSDWNKSEEEIKLAVNAAAFVTKWRYNEEPNDHGGMDFESSFNLPLGAATKVGVHTSKLLGINMLKKNATSGKKNVGVKCPQICKKCLP